jgi:Rrf2 family iron-sulfur cluster assembly transcriptional regulator
MRITLKGRYALRAMVALAEMGKNGEMVSISSLSEAEDISSIFLEQIFFKLKKAHIVKSVRGPGGGFAFDRPLDSVTVQEILDAAGEELSMKFCDKNVKDCERMSECISHKVFASVSDRIDEYLRSITLKKILESKEFKPGK